MDDSAHLCHLDVGFLMRPRDGMWTLRKFHEALEACQQVPELAGAAPACVSEGGFTWPATPESAAACQEIVSSWTRERALAQPREIRTYGCSFPFLRDVED